MRMKKNHKEDFEWILLNKKYADLTKNELAIIQELVSSETEFEETRKMLNSIHDGSITDPIPDPEIRLRLLELARKKGSKTTSGDFTIKKWGEFFEWNGAQLKWAAASLVILVFAIFFITRKEDIKKPLVKSPSNKLPVIVPYESPKIAEKIKPENESLINKKPKAKNNPPKMLNEPRQIVANDVLTKQDSLQSYQASINLEESKELISLLYTAN
jgi:hypothetical protein